MRIAVQQLNNVGVKVCKSKLDASTLKYIKQYYLSCNELYNLGYSPSPSSCEREDIFKAIFSVEYGLANRFFNALSGEFCPSLLRLELTLKDENLEEESRTVLQLLYSALEAEQALKDFGLLTDAVKFTRKSDTSALKTRLTVSRSVYNSTKVPLDSVYVQDLLYVEDGYIFKKCDYSHILVMNALTKLGVSPLVVSAAIENDTSLLLGDGFTFKDDCKFFSLLVEGQVIGKGMYGEKLFQSIEQYYKEYYATRTTKTDCITYGEQNFLDATPECIAYVNAFREQLPSNYKTHWVTSSEVIFLIEGVSKDKPIMSTELTIGNYVYDYGRKCFADPVNQLRGLSGEFVAESDLAMLGMTASGLPVQLWSYYVGSNGKVVAQVEDYYPLCCCKYIEDEDVPPLPDFVYNKKFEWLSVKETCKKLGVSSLESIAREIADAIDIEYGSHTSDFRLFVGHLVQALICIRCDYTLKWHKTPNHIMSSSDMTWLDSNAFELAIYEAKNVFEKLGF